MMEENQMQNPRKSPVSFRGPILRGLLPAVPVGVIVLLLFGAVGGNWLIGGMAGFCCMLGVFLCAFGWSYLKAMDRYAQEHPQENGEEAPLEDTAPETAETI